MNGSSGVSGGRSSPWEGYYEKPLPNQDRRSAENVANSPWLQAAPTSALCKYLEEALAESYAQVKVNGLHALPEGLMFPIREGYVSVSRTVGEAAIGTIVYGGVLYGVYVTASK